MLPDRKKINLKASAKTATAKQEAYAPRKPKEALFKALPDPHRAPTPPFIWIDYPHEFLEKKRV